MQFEHQLPHSQNNGAYAFTEIRNSITHSAPENRQTFLNTSNTARVEAQVIGLWYLELILLRLFNYQGHYFNRSRLGNINIGDVEQVPWV
jgi:hypothetical protein